MKAAGFSLVEAVVATAIVGVLAAAVAPLLVVSAGQVDVARLMSVAALLAGGKLEELRALSWDSPLLAASPAGALAADTPGYVDYLDASGDAHAALPGGPPPGTAFIRRWSIDPIGAAAGRAVVVQVVVAPAGARVRGGSFDVRAIAVRARRGS
jgi:prepilin-type N-terminal cleavage/methylation domain-containing protein